MKRHLRFTPLIMALALIALTAGNGLAALTAGTQISNTATVSYNEGPSVSSVPVIVTVSLVSGLDWLETTLQTSNTFTVGNAGFVTYTADLRNTGNGTTTVTITDNTTEDDPATLDPGVWSISPTIPANDLILFGAISNGAGSYDGTNTTIPVTFLDPADLLDGVTRIMIGAGTYYYEATGSNSTTLVVAGDASGNVAAAGVQMGEVINITFSGNAGSLDPGTYLGDHRHEMIATDEDGATPGFNADGNAADSDTLTSNGTDDWFTHVVAGQLTIAKYSRNVAGLNPTGAADKTYAGRDYWLSGVKGISATDTIEYLIVITNAGPGSASAVTVTDTISAFLTFATASVDIDTDGDGTFDITDAIASDAALWADPLLTVFPGTGGDATPPTGGLILAPVAPATEVVSAIRYRAAIQ